jgi:hypothetical protein
MIDIDDNPAVIAQLSARRYTVQGDRRIKLEQGRLQETDRRKPRRCRCFSDVLRGAGSGGWSLVMEESMT